MAEWHPSTVASVAKSLPGVLGRASSAPGVEVVSISAVSGAMLGCGADVGTGDDGGKGGVALACCTAMLTETFELLSVALRPKCRRGIRLRKWSVQAIVLVD